MLGSVLHVGVYAQTLVQLGGSCHSPVGTVGWLCKDLWWSNKWTRG